MRRLFAVVAITALAGGCSQRETGENAAGSRQPAGFVDKVWTVVESPGGSGDLYVFLSDGTLIRTSKGAVPDVGKWSWDGTQLTYMQSANVYTADVDSLTDSYLGITIHFMKRAWSLGLVPAAASMPDTTRPVEFEPQQASIIIHGNNPVWLLSIENDRATLRMNRQTVWFTGGEWVQDCASVWDYSAHAPGSHEKIEVELSTATCVDSTSGAESPLSAFLTRGEKSYYGCAVAGKLRVDH